MNADERRLKQTTFYGLHLEYLKVPAAGGEHYPVKFNMGLIGVHRRISAVWCLFS